MSSRLLVSDAIPLSDAGPVKTHRSLVLVRFVRDSDVSRVKHCASSALRSDRMCTRESEAKVSASSPKTGSARGMQQFLDHTHICTL